MKKIPKARSRISKVLHGVTATAATASSWFTQRSETIRPLKPLRFMGGAQRLTLLVFLTATTLLLPLTAHAVPIDLTLVLGAPIFQQTANSPCIYDNSSCTPNGFVGTLLPPNTTPIGDPIPLIAPPSGTYTVGQITGLVGNTFVVGIDQNQSGVATNPLNGISLDFFEMKIDNVQEFVYNGPTTIPIINNGNGFSDASLQGFDLSTFGVNQQVVFNLTYSNATDGREQFFIASSASAVPEPSTLLLLGSGLIGLGAWRWRQGRTNK